MRSIITSLAFLVGYLAGGCVTLRAADASWEWWPVANTPEQVSLFRDGQQYGNWDRSKGEFFRRTEPGKFRLHKVPAEANIPSPALTADDVANMWPKGGVGELVEPKFGVDEKKLSEGVRERTINGKPVTRKQEIEALEGTTKDGVIPDDSSKTYLTVIGSDADRAKVTADIQGNPVLKALTCDMLVKSLPPERWELKAGFETTGTPTIYLQAPDPASPGRYKVVWRQNEYFGALALAETIRDRDPNYNPALDPQPRPPVQPSAPLAASDDTDNLLLLALVVGAGIVIALVAKRKAVQ